MVCVHTRPRALFVRGICSLELKGRVLNASEVPTDDDMAKARLFMRQLEAATREDHLRSIDEVLTHAPRELLQQARALHVSGTFPLRTPPTTTTTTPSSNTSLAAGSGAVCVDSGVW